MLECFCAATCFFLIALSGVLVVFWFYLWRCFPVFKSLCSSVQFMLALLKWLQCDFPHQIRKSTGHIHELSCYWDVFCAQNKKKSISSLLTSAWCVIYSFSLSFSRFQGWDWIPLGWGQGKYPQNIENTDTQSFTLKPQSTLLRGDDMSYIRQDLV